MGAKAKTASNKKTLKRVTASAAKSKSKSSDLVVAAQKPESADFLPLEGGPARKLPKSGKPLDTSSAVLYVGRIPHGFYEKEME
ncbi:hypothetical protein MKX03_022702, partial [Papaver bracteatum]